MTKLTEAVELAIKRRNDLERSEKDFELYEALSYFISLAEKLNSGILEDVCIERLTYLHDIPTWNGAEEGKNLATALLKEIGGEE